MNLKAIIYRRVSSRKQALNGYSLENQETIAITISHTHSHDIVETFTDSAVSVSKGSKKQDAYREMMTYCEEHDIKRIYTYHIDRLGRSIPAIFKFFDWAEENKISVCTTANGFIFDMSGKKDINTTIILTTFAMITMVEGTLREERVSLARESAYDEKTGKYKGYGPGSRKGGQPLIVHEDVLSLLKKRVKDPGISISAIALRAKCSEKSVYNIKAEAVACGALEVT